MMHRIAANQHVLSVPQSEMYSVCNTFNLCVKGCHVYFYFYSIGSKYFIRMVPNIMVSFATSWLDFSLKFSTNISGFVTVIRHKKNHKSCVANCSCLL